MHIHIAFHGLLLSTISLPGDTGEGEEPTEGQLIRESDNTFMIWASGRQNCLGMAVQLDVRILSMTKFHLALNSFFALILQLLQRHDLFNMLLGLFKSEMDTVVSKLWLHSSDFS